jgi:hypothetical protein
VFCQSVKLSDETLRQAEHSRIFYSSSSVHHCDVALSSTVYSTGQRREFAKM